MKLVDVKPSTYIESSKKIIYQDPTFKIDDIVRTSKYKNIFAKDYVPNWSEEVSVIKKLKSLFGGHMLFVILKGEKIVERFTKKELKKANQKVIEKGKVIKRKGNKLCVKWKGYDIFFNSWIDGKYKV